MKTLKTLGLMLLIATGAMAQINPDNMFISGYVVDGSGLAQNNYEVCVAFVSNNPSLPSDTICTTTNANGYYFIDIQNGSLTGPNVTFEVSTTDTCSGFPLWQSVSNGQGSIDTASVNFTVCGNTSVCEAAITTTVDSSFLGTVYTFQGSGTGSAPFTYNWWVNGNNYTGQTLTYQASQNEIIGICLTIADANGCSATTCDTVYPIGCDLEIQYSNSTGSDLLTAVPSGTPPFTYIWNTGENTQTINVTGFPGVYCVNVIDATGCQTATVCDTVGPNSGCSVEITTTVDSTGGGLVYTLYASAGFSSYQWSTGETSQEITVQNVSPNGEVYCVSATTSAGCTATACDTILPVNSNGCQAYFAWSPDSVLGSPLPAAQFTDMSLGSPVAWYWDFGDGTTSTAQNPLHSYPGTGVYYVCLTIITQNQQCQSTYCDTVYLGNNGNGGCNAAFSNSGPTPLGYTFSANVQNNNLYYYWTIDNQYVGNGFEAYAPGLANGVHTICLSVIDSLNNCSDTQCQTITVGGNNCYGYIAGQVYAGTNNNPLDAGVVYLITFDPNTNLLTAVDSMVLDSGNFYFFGPLACGDYMVKAAAFANSQYYSNHIPTYYGNSPFWGFAQTIDISAPNTQVTADVMLIAANNPGGPGFIGGDVTQGANKMDPGDPMVGMQVMLFNLAGDAIAYTYTDENGEFGFADLEYGTYQVYVEALGIQTIPAVVTIGPDQPSYEEVHILASENLISTGIEEFDFEGAIGEVYPNPVANEASIKFNLETSTKVDISILDLTGRTISTRTVSVANGENTLQITTNGLTDGCYFFNIQGVDGSFSVTRKFMRVD